MSAGWVAPAVPPATGGKPRIIPLVNYSTVLPGAGTLALIAHACTLHLTQDFCPAWGLLPPVVTPGDPGWGLPSIVVFNDAEQAASLGYAGPLGPGGLPFSRVFARSILDAYGDGAGPVQWLAHVCPFVAHEADALTLDPDAADWTLAADGDFYAREPCQPVNGAEYTQYGTGAVLPDFLLPAWFGSSSGRVDHLDVLGGTPFAIATGCWAIRWAAGPEVLFSDRQPAGSSSSAVGPPEWVLAMSQHPASRTARRLAAGPDRVLDPAGASP